MLSLTLIPFRAPQPKTLPTSITKYFASLADLDDLTDVVKLTSLVEPLEEKWPIHRVKRYFEEGGSNEFNGPVICPSLPARGLPATAAPFIESRNRSELLRLIREVPNFLCRTILAERSSVYAVKMLPYDAWVSVIHGGTSVVYKMEGQESGQASVLKQGDFAVYPKGGYLSMHFEGHSLLSMGYLAPE